MSLGRMLKWMIASTALVGCQGKARLSVVPEVAPDRMVLTPDFAKRLETVRKDVTTALASVQMEEGTVHPLEAAREYVACVERNLSSFPPPGDADDDTARRRLYLAFHNLVADAEQIVKDHVDGRDFFRMRRGSFIRFYRSKTDDSLQPYGISVPPGYRPSRALPLAVGLHGYDAINTRDYWIIYFSASTLEGDKTPEPEVISLNCLGRGNTLYQILGEQDVLRGIQDVRHNYSVDEDRVTLNGFSMGGAGTWSLAAKYPHLFSGISPQAGFVGSGGGPPEGGDESYVSLLATAYWRAENFLHLPIYCLHGARDPVVSPENSRRMTARLRELGHPDIVYVEVPEAGHGFRGDVASKATEWTRTKRRVAPPIRLRHGVAGLSAGTGYWLRADLIERPGYPALFDAAVTSPKHVVLKTTNLSRLTILPTAPLRRRFVAEVDGTTLSLRMGADGVTLSRCAADLTPLPAWTDQVEPITVPFKRIGLEGPIADILSGRTIYVPGTLENAQGIRDALSACSDLLASNTNGGMMANLPIISDVDLSEEEIRRSNLILFGDGRSNSIVGRIRDELPVSFLPDAIEVGDKRLSGPGVGAMVIYPNPLAPDRYVLVVATASPASMSDLAKFPGEIFNFMSHPDYVVFRIGETVETLQEGVFDSGWRLVP